MQWGFEKDQRTRTQKWYEHKDKDKERKSKLDALEEVFRFIHLKYHKLWCDEPDYDASYAPPTRADLEAALLELESAQASWIATPNGVSSGHLNCYSKWSQSAQASWIATPNNGGSSSQLTQPVSGPQKTTLSSFEHRCSSFVFVATF